MKMTAANLASCQRTLDNQAEPEDFDREELEAGLTEDEALSQATDDAERTPELMLCMLEMHIDPREKLEPVDVAALRRPDRYGIDYDALTVRELFAVWIAGLETERSQAGYLLREKMLVDSKDWISDRAKELQA